jgi:hypothetical protein
MNVATFWDVAQCSVYVTDVSDQRITSIFRVDNQPSHLLHIGFLLCKFPTLKMEAILPPRRRFSNELHGAISQKVPTIIIAAVRTSDPM